MTADEFVSLVGPELTHVTAAANVAVIRALGLLRPVELAVRARVAVEHLILREAPLQLTMPEGVALLNHQRPLRAGHRADFLEGMTLADWGAQLDGRVFFWPGRVRQAFRASVAARGDVAVLRVNARQLWAHCAPMIDLAPINTGAATRRPVRRGLGIYVPVTASVAAFRQARGRRDRVVEVSVRCDVPATLITDVAQN